MDHEYAMVRDTVLFFCKFLITYSTMPHPEITNSGFKVILFTAASDGKTCPFPDTV